MKRLLLLILAGFVCLASVLVVRTLGFKSRQLEVPQAPPVRLDTAAAAQRLGAAVRILTISTQDSAGRDPAAFQALHQFLADSFPRAHAVLTRDTVNGLSLLYSWAGSDPSLPPLLLLAHQDVVPVEPGTEGQWKQPPFEGRVVDGYIWGRGTMDDKGSLVAIMEAIELLAGEGYEPRRPVMLAFGHDEEIGGTAGATVLAKLLASRGVKPELVIDEGGVIAEGLMPGITRPVAMIGTAEKGFLSLTLTVSGTGGHSSMPPAYTTVGTLAAAIQRLEANPFPMELVGASKAMFDHIGPEFPFPQRLVFANTWLLGPVVTRIIGATPSGAAMLRTTTAPTMFDGGIKSNVLPSSASAVVNFRILPGETVASVTERVRELIADSAIHIDTIPGEAKDPSAVSPDRGPEFELIARTIRETWPGTLVTPYLVVGGTDSRQYGIISPNIYRFAPMRVRAADDDLERVHGADERLSVADYANAVRFYRQLILNATR